MLLRNPYLWLAATILALAGCAGLGDKSGAVNPAVKLGEQIYVTKCTACHSAQPVRKFDLREWDKIIAEMAPRAKLTPEETDALTAYVRHIVKHPSGL